MATLLQTARAMSSECQPRGQLVKYLTSAALRLAPVHPYHLLVRPAVSRNSPATVSLIAETCWEGQLEECSM
ncbi:unnamed protein product [Amoebophrya sp. A120]|nr:unnamed protein product [Amoebophrya sp. A120]|eukprot:GSA120T00016868001.1